MNTKRMGRPRKVPPGQEWLLEPTPDYLLPGLAGQLQAQDQLLDSLEQTRVTLIKEFGGFGIPNELAYSHADAIAWDAEMSESHRQKVLKQVEAARALVARGNQKGGKVVRLRSEPRREDVLQRHAQMIAERRARGHTENAIANRLVELEGVSLSTAKRWLKK
jgi:hypothetical protein